MVGAMLERPLSLMSFLSFLNLFEIKMKITGLRVCEGQGVWSLFIMNSALPWSPVRRVS